MVEPKVSVIVPSWNGLADTIECLESLRGHDYPNLDIILVDNGSWDGTPQRVQRQFPEVHQVQNGRNLGFARACNIGFRHAVRRGADYLFFLNNDATIDPGCLRELVAVAEEEKGAGIVGVLARHTAGPARVEAGHRVAWRTGKISAATVPAAAPRVLEVDYAWGCGLLVSTSLFGKLGFRELYGSYYEDADLCLRAARLGYRTVIATQATIHHKVSRSGDRAFLRQAYLRSRNMLLFLLLNSPPRYLLTAIPICLAYRIPRLLYDYTHLYLAHRLRGRFPERPIALLGPRPNRRVG